MTQIEWEKLAEVARNNYDDSTCLDIDMKKFFSCLDAFECLYRARTTKKEEEYYCGNLISTGRLEGPVEVVIGTVSDAVERTRIYYLKKGKMSARNAGVVLRNLVNVLRKEEFNAPVDSILGAFKHDIIQIANGTLA